MAKQLQFGIYSPEIKGLVQNIPSMLLSKAYSPDNRSVRLREGELRSAKGRFREFVESVYSTGAVCTTSGSATIILIASNVYTASTHFPCWGSDDPSAATGRQITIGGVDYTIKSIDSATQWTLDTVASATNGNTHSITGITTGTKTFTIAGDQTAQYTADDSIAVNGSTGGDNDGTYTVVSATLNGGNTDIVVSEAITNGSPAAKGNITDKGVALSVGTVETLVPAPDGNPLIHYRTIEINSGGAATEYTFGFTKAHAYLWSQAWSAWILKFTCDSDCTMWDSAQYFDEILATNNVDKPLRWGATTSALMSEDWGDGANGPLVSVGVYIDAAKFVTVFKNYIIFGYTTEGGDVNAHRIRWNDLTLGIEEWDSGDAGSDEIQGDGVLNGFGRAGSFIIVAKTRSMKYGWAVESTKIFQFEMASYTIGTDAPHSMINDADGNMYFLGSNFTFYKFRTDGDHDEISAFISPRVENIHPDYVSGIVGTYVAVYNTLNWSVPYGSEATANNEQWRCMPEVWSWAIDDMAIYAYGKYKRDSGYTFDTYPFDAFDQIAWDSFDNAELTAGFAPDICSDASGYTYALHSSEQDVGSDYTRYHEFSTPLTDEPSFGIDKFLQSIEIIHRRESTGTLEVEVKRNTESNYTSMGTIDLTGTTGLKTVNALALQDVIIQKLSCLSGSMKASHFNIKIKATNRFRILGLIMKFTLIGERIKV